VKAKIVPIEQSEKGELEQLLFEYFQEIDPSKVVSESRREIDYPYLDLYWKEESRKPFFIEYDNENIGFVLINDWIVNKEYNAKYSVAEFYIKPKFRRNRIGHEIVQELLIRFKGKWEIRQSTNNLVAINFWRNCIGNYKELKVKSNEETEYVQNFES